MRGESGFIGGGGGGVGTLTGYKIRCFHMSEGENPKNPQKPSDKMKAIVIRSVCTPNFDLMFYF